MIPFVILAVFSVTVFVTDIKYTKIPNRFTVPCILIGIIYYMLKDGWSGLFFSVVGCLAGFALLALLYFCRAVGAGDVKLFAAIGALTGAGLALYTLMYSVFYAGLIGIVVIVSKRSIIRRIRQGIYTLYCSVVYKEKHYLKEAAAQAGKFPFMLAVLPGAVTAFYFLTGLSGLEGF